MTDHLEQIKRQWEGKRMTPSENIDWLITEVERLRGMMEKDSIRTREHNVLVEENRTLSARLAEVVNIYPEMEQIENYKTTIATLRNRLQLTNAAILHEIPKSGVHPTTQAFLLPFVELNEKALAKGEE